MVAALMVSCAQLQAVPRAAKASFTSHKGSIRSRPQLRSRIVSMAAPKTAEEKSAIETAIDAAKETCESGTAGACATAWDEVEELSASAADKKQAKSTADPLDIYCDDNPEADECRVYED